MIEEVLQLGAQHALRRRGHEKLAVTIRPLLGPTRFPVGAGPLLGAGAGLAMEATGKPSSIGEFIGAGLMGAGAGALGGFGVRGLINLRGQGKLNEAATLLEKYMLAAKGAGPDYAMPMADATRLRQLRKTLPKIRRRMTSPENLEALVMAVFPSLVGGAIVRDVSRS